VNPPLWIAIALSGAALAGATGRGIRRAYNAILFIKDLMQVVHDRSSELTATGGDSVRDRVEAIDAWRQDVDSNLASYGARIAKLEQDRRRAWL
jgi:hypothetical protein